MLEIGNRTPENLGAYREQAADIARNGSAAEVGMMLLGLCRQIRKECRGQAEGIPDLTKHQGQIAEAALVYEYLPELASRYLKSAGAQVLKVAKEQGIPSLSHFDDTELRLAIGDCMRASRFAAIGSRLRMAGSDHLATEIFAADFAEGNVVEIATSRMVPALIEGHPDRARDCLAIDRDRAAKRSSYADLEEETVPSPGF